MIPFAGPQHQCRFFLTLALAGCGLACMQPSKLRTPPDATDLKAVVVNGDGQSSDAVDEFKKWLVQAGGHVVADIQGSWKLDFFRQGGGANNGTLLFYVGDGSAEGWTGSSDNLETITDARFGATKEAVRYLWFCSCQTFADGPNCQKAGFKSPDYFYPGTLACPRPADRAGETLSAFHRWEHALGPNIRLACGPSTATPCTSTTSDWLWDNAIKQHMDVADAFISGLHMEDDVMPVCIARGGASPIESGLYDDRFNTAIPLHREPGYDYLEYVRPFATSPASKPATILHDFQWALARIVPPDPPAAMAEQPAELDETAREVQKCRQKAAEREGDRNEVYCAIGELGQPIQDLNLPAEEKYLTAAVDFATKMGWCTGDTCHDWQGYRLMINGSPADGGSPVTHYQKAVIVAIPVATMMWDGSQMMRVLSIGTHGRIVLELNHEAQVVNASYHGPEHELAPITAGILIEDDAEALARQSLAHASYTLSKWRFGLKALDDQVHSAPFYTFDFTPGKESPGAAPQHVEVPAAKPAPEH